MAKTYFYYGAMNSGKSIILQAVAYNYEERDQRVVIVKPSVDVKSPKVSSRVGAEREVDWALQPEDSPLAFLQKDREQNHAPLRCIIVDEAQFLTPKQVDELFFISVEMNIPVMAYGLRGDFRTHAFPGSLRLLEVAHTLGELKTICRCGKKATFNGRKISGEFVSEGSQVAIDGVDAEYESLCPNCFIAKVGVPTAKE